MGFFDKLTRALPGSLGQRLEETRKDLSQLARTITGEKAPPFRQKEGKPEQEAAPEPSASKLLHARRLRVCEVRRETRDAVTLVLEDASGGALHFTPGQFFTLLVSVGGETLRRAYSVSSAPAELPRVAITVKRVDKGRASTHLNEAVREGDVLEALGPSGNFAVEPDAAAARELVLLGGGSGITPLYSIARAVLAVEPGTRVSLVYGNRGLEDVIFRDALAALEREHAGRFVLRHVLQSPPEGWTGGVGMLDAATAAAQLEALAPTAAAEYFVCGPEPMMKAAREALLARGVAAEKIHEERFVNPEAKAPASSEQGPHPFVVKLGGKRHELTVKEGATLLETGLAAGLDMPFSCAMGGCGACRVRKTAGEVTMEEPNCLSQSEASEGYILACVSRPRGPVSVEVE